MSTISNGQEQASLANSQRATQDLHNKANSINSLQTRLLPPQDKEKKLREACEGFETIFIKKMWEEMQATVQESDFLKGRDEKHWKSMYNQELAETLSKAGGIGLADMMYRQLSGNLVDATRATVTTSFGGNATGFELKPVPLFNTTDINPNNNTSPIKEFAQNVASTPQNITTNPMPQNKRSIYAREDIQPTAPNLEEIRNQSIKNANDAVAGMKSINTNKADSNYDNSKVIQNVLDRLNNNNNANNTQATNANAQNNITMQGQNIASMQGQNNATNTIYSANMDNKNHVLQPNLNSQPVRVNAYVEPLVDKVGANAVLPNRTAKVMPRNTSRLPEQTGLNQAQVHGNPGITPSKYVHNSPFVVQHRENNKTSMDSNEQIASTANNMNTANNYEAALMASKADTNAQIDANANTTNANNTNTNTTNANNTTQMASRTGAIQNQNYIPINSQNSYMGQGQNIQQRQDLNVLPSKRKTNMI